MSVWETAAIADSMLVPTGYERTLPPGLQLTVRTRRRVLARRARGRVLDLGGAEAHAALWGAAREVTEVVHLDRSTGRRRDLGRVAALAAEGQRFDTVFSVFQLASAPDLDQALAGVRDVLAPDGIVLFLEPARLTGATGRAQRLVAPSLATATGWWVDRDIPAALRASGLSVTDLERHRSNTVQWWLRSLVEGTAHPSLLSGLHQK